MSFVSLFRPRHGLIPILILFSHLFIIITQGETFAPLDSNLTSTHGITLASPPSVFHQPRGHVAPTVFKDLHLRLAMDKYAREMNAACAEITDCNLCYETTGCHFCENDFKCHAYGSIHGCVYGLSCNKTSPCLRTSPEYHGYAKQSAGTYATIVIVGLILGSVIIGIMWLAFFCKCGSRGEDDNDDGEPKEGGEEMVRYTHHRDENDGMTTAERLSVGQAEYVEMNSPPDQTRSLHSTTSARDVNTSELSTLSSLNARDPSHDSSAGQGAYQPPDNNWGRAMESEAAMERSARKAWGGTRGSSSGGGSNGSSNSSSSSSSHSGLSPDDPANGYSFARPTDAGGCGGRCRDIRCNNRLVFRILSILTIIVVIVGIIVVSLLYPTSPAYSLCNTKIQWGSILGYVISLNEAAYVKLQVSLHNPNRFSLDVSRLTCYVTYDAVTVGHATVNDFTMPQGKIVDLAFDAQIHPPLTTATKMLSDYVAGTFYALHLRGYLLLPPFLALILHHHSYPSSYLTSFDYPFLLGSLLVDMVVLIDTDFKLFDQRLHHVNASYVFEKIDIAAPANRKLCKCP